MKKSLGLLCVVLLTMAGCISNPNYILPNLELESKVPLVVGVEIAARSIGKIKGPRNRLDSILVEMEKTSLTTFAKAFDHVIVLHNDLIPNNVDTIIIPEVQMMKCGRDFHMFTLKKMESVVTVTIKYTMVDRQGSIIWTKLVDSGVVTRDIPPFTSRWGMEDQEDKAVNLAISAAFHKAAKEFAESNDVLMFAAAKRKL